MKKPPTAPAASGLSQDDMMTWHPGTPVLTEQDHADWQAWRRERALALQRERRASLRRIDYYPSPEAAAVIDAQRTGAAGGDASSILNRIVAEWAARLPELNRRK